MYIYSMLHGVLFMEVFASISSRSMCPLTEVLYNTACIGAY